VVRVVVVVVMVVMMHVVMQQGVPSSAATWMVFKIRLTLWARFHRRR